MRSGQYTCACCNQIWQTNHLACSHCGSQQVKSPYSFWVFCLLSCLSVIMVIKGVHLYTEDHRQVPQQISILKILEQKN